jgi:hypothetical protein
MNRLLLIIITLVQVKLFAFDQGTPAPCVTTSFNGAVFFAMVPEYHDGIPQWNGGKGTMYVVQTDGSLKPLWTVTGWYSRKVIISNDGVYLVRLSAGPIQDMQIKKPEEPLLWVYRNGNLLRKYEIGDFNLNRNSDLYAYKWLLGLDKENIGISEDVLYLVLCDNRSLRINLNTGLIIQK